MNKQRDPRAPIRRWMDLDTALSLVRFDHLVEDVERSPQRFSWVAALTIEAIQKARRQ